MLGQKRQHLVRDCAFIRVVGGSQPGEMIDETLHFIELLGPDVKNRADELHGSKLCASGQGVSTVY